MTKKISIVGRGTAGCLAIAHFLAQTDWDIDWVYDPEIQPTPVGEGTNLFFPEQLREDLNWFSLEMENMFSVPKLGIWKRGWGPGQNFKHTFPVGQYALHFSAVDFQAYVFDQLRKNSRVRCQEANVTDPASLDADHVMMCTGSPELNDDYVVHDYIPVNSAMVFQCPWNEPKFLYSLTFARRHGWIFGIPLQNRCAIGYVFNENFASDEEIYNEAQEILNEFGLVPSLKRRLRFRNYSRKSNFTPRVCYNGNASYFLEPLEATSTGVACQIIKRARHSWIDGYDEAHPASLYRFLNQDYVETLNNIENMILLHYFAGSVYDTDFWHWAQQRAQEKLSHELQHNEKFSSFIRRACSDEKITWKTFEDGDVGSWPLRSYRLHADELDIRNKFQTMLNN